MIHHSETQIISFTHLKWSLRLLSYSRINFSVPYMISNPPFPILFHCYFQCCTCNCKSKLMLWKQQWNEGWTTRTTESYTRQTEMSILWCNKCLVYRMLFTRDTSHKLCTSNILWAASGYTEIPNKNLFWEELDLNTELGKNFNEGNLTWDY
jgi:hypothetical protein